MNEWVGLPFLCGDFDWDFFQGPLVRWLIVGIILLLIGTAQARQKRRHHNLRTTFWSIAQHTGGQFTQANWKNLPEVRFEHSGCRAMLNIQEIPRSSAVRQRRPWYTQLQIAWPDFNARLQVYPERFYSQIGKVLGTQDLDVGEAEFDRKFIIQSNRPAEVPLLLSVPARTEITYLRSLLGNDDIYVRLQTGVMLVKKRGVFQDPGLLREFVDSVLRLHDAMRQSIRVQGIEFLDPDSSASWDHAAKCQVCGEEMEPLETVFCSSCATPHHEECWTYFGKCSTYGCGSSNFRSRPR